jgi:hypothetical protein
MIYNRFHDVLEKLLFDMLFFHSNGFLPPREEEAANDQPPSWG